MSALELWGGVECTVNRVGDTWFDQFDLSGHHRRSDDLERFASLGVRALRYPVLWERVAAKGLGSADWTWTDQRLVRLASLGIRPVVGLVHHGSGPAGTHLLDSRFATGLARFARAVAERYPEVRDYTPINEPLTTARFSALYGHWYPHARDTASFLRALLHQVQATVLAMRAIREVTPTARLIQTEDACRVWGTPALAKQVEYENARRWLSLDLLCGRVVPGHDLYDHLLQHGILADELEELAQSPCPPDVVGLNYYLTSDRFLDDRLDAYPSGLHGGNGTQQYADVEAVRTRSEGIAGHEAILQEAWERYRLPVAITEAHLGGTRDEQLRWFAEAWQAAQRVREDGVDVRAVTAWSLLGAFDWQCLLTRRAGTYESGVFDLRGSEPRPTALASMLRAFGRGQAWDHPVLDVPGWWRRPQRLLYPVEPSGRTAEEPVEPSESQPVVESEESARLGRHLLIIGATGTLGQAFARICDLRGLPHRLVGRADVDIAEPSSVARALDRWQPWALINTAGYVRVDEAEADRHRCTRDNALGPAVLAAACAARGIRLVTFSSDLVFDGRQSRPYLEHDDPRPLNLYGRTKAEAERRVQAAWDGALVVRTSAFFGPWDQHNFVTQVLDRLRRGETVHAPEDLVVSPTYVPDLVHACLDLLIDGAAGLWHLANPGEVTWHELGRRTAHVAGLDPHRVIPCRARDMGWHAPRPPYSALGSSRGVLLPDLDESLRRYLGDRGS